MEWTALALGAALLALPLSPRPDSRPASPSPQPAPRTPVFSTETRLVALNVTVTDHAKRFVSGLTREDFEVVDDGVPQQVALFGEGSIPLDLAILLDTSGSVSDRAPMVQEAAAGFVHRLRPEDRAMVVGFNQRVSVLQDWTSDSASVVRAIRATSDKGGTSLYTALYIALKSFQKPAPGASAVRRQVLVVLSDGDDTTSTLSFDDVLDTCRRAGVTIYTIQLRHPPEFGPEPWQVRKGPAGVAPEFVMTHLASETGGRAFTLQRVEDLASTYASIAEELSNQYTLGYAPEGGRTNQPFRYVQVLVPGHPDASPRTRTGYYGQPSGIP